MQQGRRAHGLVHDGLPGLDLQQGWDELAVATGAPPWARPGWIVPWWTAFGGTPVLVVSRGPAGELRAVLPLRRTRAGLASATNWHSPEFAPVAVDDEARADVLAMALAHSRGRLTLDFTDSALAEQVAAVAARHGGRSVSRVRERSPYLRLLPGWEDGLSTHLRAELRRRERRLAERGRVELDLQDGRTGLDRLLAEVLAVEASGWKGRQGTAIASDPTTRAFYERVCAWAADEGLLRLALLRLDGNPVAVDLALEHAGVQYLLKTGFDERERPLAPGKLLRWQVLRDCAARGVTTYELLGHAQPWKHDWTPLRDARLQVHAFASGGSGTVQWAVHAGALPAVRRVRDRLAAGSQERQDGS